MPDERAVRRHEPPRAWVSVRRSVRPLQGTHRCLLRRRPSPCQAHPAVCRVRLHRRVSHVPPDLRGDLGRNLHAKYRPRCSHLGSHHHCRLAASRDQLCREVSIRPGRCRPRSTTPSITGGPSIVNRSLPRPPFSSMRLAPKMLAVSSPLPKRARRAVPTQSRPMPSRSSPSPPLTVAEVGHPVMLTALSPSPVSTSTLCPSATPYTQIWSSSPRANTFCAGSAPWATMTSGPSVPITTA